MFWNTEKVYSTFCITRFLPLNHTPQKTILNYCVLENMHFLSFLPVHPRVSFSKGYFFLLVKQLCHLCKSGWQQEPAAWNEAGFNRDLFVAAVSLTHVQSHLWEKKPQIYKWSRDGTSCLAMSPAAGPGD